MARWKKVFWDVQKWPGRWVGRIQLWEGGLLLKIYTYHPQDWKVVCLSVGDVRSDLFNLLKLPLVTVP